MMNKIIKCKSKDLKKELATAFENQANSHRQKCSYRSTFPNYNKKTAKSKDLTKRYNRKTREQTILEYDNKISEILSKRAIKQKILEGYLMKVKRTMNEIYDLQMEQNYYEQKIKKLETEFINNAIKGCPGEDLFYSQENIYSLDNVFNDLF